MARLYANNYTSTLASAITNSATTIVVTNATGLPTITGADYYHLTLAAGGTIEIVKVTARTGTSLTVTRAQESTTAVAWAAGEIISLRETAATFTSIPTAPGSSTDNAVVRFDGTGGSTFQNSVITVDDTGVVAGIASITVGTTTVATNDKVLLNDTSASDVTKTATAQSIADLCLNTSGNYVSGGTDVAVADGGTGRSTATAYAVVLGGTTSTGAYQSAASGSTGQILQSAGNAAVPTWSTPTYPSTSGTSGKILVSDGTNNVYSTPTFPNASATSRKKIVSDGTNWVASTETWAVPGTTGNVLTSDGTNWVSSAPSAGSGLTRVNATSSPTSCAVDTEYVPTSGASLHNFTLPATCAIGQVVTITGYNSGTWKLIANTGQTIKVASSTTTSAGYLQAYGQWDSVCVRCVEANTTWVAYSIVSQGLTIA